MKEGDIALASLPQADGETKTRPVLLLRSVPPYGDFLVCGISSQLRREVAGFDDIIRTTDADFSASGLKTASLIRLGFLTALPQGSLAGTIGSFSPERHKRLLQRLSEHLVEDVG